MTNRVKSTFGGSDATSTCMFCTGPRLLMVTRPRALALRHPAAPADRTMLKTMLSFVAAVAVETNADSPMATASVEKMNFVFILALVYSFNCFVIWYYLPP